MNTCVDCHEPLISLEHVSFAYENKQVLKDISFTVLQRDFVGLIGPNGAGKTTLMRMIVGLLKPNTGTIQLFGQPIAQFKDWERIGYVPQKNALNPLFPATVQEVVQSGLYSRKKLFKRITRQDQKKVEDALHVMNIHDLSQRRIGQLSGGQQQRVFLARALVNNPDLLILDEPTVGIDAETQEGFFHMIRHLHQHHEITFLMVSHDMEMLRSYFSQEPKMTFDRLKFYVKHSHEIENCDESNLTHSLEDLRARMDHELMDKERTPVESY